jgi:signal transduction histidine kinase/CheY-like chemotaxis protein
LENANRQLQQEIADRRRVQSELHAAKDAAERANAYKSTFIANVSHEIRTPLNAILGYAQILQRRTNLDSEARRCIDTIEGSGSHLLGLINDILDLSKIEAGKMEIKTGPFDLSALVTDLGTMFELRCSQKALFWAVEGIDPTIPIHLSGDAGKLRQVLINLLDNALKFTRSGGITLRVLPRGNDRFSFEVADTGRGLDAQARRVIFEPFTQVKALTQVKPFAQVKAFTQVGDVAQTGGAGLGLAISRRFVELMGGRLGLISQPGRGTCFHFELSLTSMKWSGRSRSVEGAAFYQIVPGKDALTAVVADDDADNRSYLATVLQEGGMTVHTATNGVEALKLIAKASPDIVFLDHYMPLLDGLQTILRLRSRPEGDRLKVVLVTAAAITRDGKPLENLGADATLLKPFKVQDVFDCLVNLLKVKLIAAPQAAQAEATPLTDLALEGHLRERLLEAAEYGQVSALKRLIDRLESGRRPQTALGQRLRMLLNQYDLDGIKTLVRSVPAHSSPDAARLEDPQ